MEEEKKDLKEYYQTIHSDFWSWLAGFIDGEGSINLAKEHDKRKGKDCFHYRPMLQITNTDYNVLEFIKSMLDCGDPIIQPKLKSDKHQFHYQYKIRKQDDLYLVLCNLIPRLKIKSIQAIRVIQFIKNRKSCWRRGWYAPLNKKDHELFDELKLLNCRGKTARLLKQNNKGEMHG